MKRNPEKTARALRLLREMLDQQSEEMKKYEQALKGVDTNDVIDDFWGDEIVEDCGQAVDDYDYIYFQISRDKIVMEDFFRPRGSVEPVEQSRLTIEGMDYVVELICALKVDVNDADEILGNLYDALVKYANDNNIRTNDGFLPLFDSLDIEYKKTGRK